MGLSDTVRRLQRRVGGAAFRSSVRTGEWLGRNIPLATVALPGVEILRDLRYAEGGGPRGHLLDLYRPTDVERPPVVLYVHGGAFRLCSKETHWVFATTFARRGYMVANINYRLAPEHPFPAALIDVSEALRWLVASVEGFGGDPSRIVLAGESAGGNLVTALALMTAYERKEAWARAVWDLCPRIKAVVPMCAILEVHGVQRLIDRNPDLSPWLSDIIADAERSYLRDSDVGVLGRQLADPLTFLERAGPPDRPIPPFFASVGTADPLLDDTRRLGAALERLDVPHQVRYYPDEIHAFQAMVWRAQARRCWQDTFTFLDEVFGAHP